jgi:hypothetical protein
MIVWVDAGPHSKHVQAIRLDINRNRSIYRSSLYKVHIIYSYLLPKYSVLVVIVKRKV